MRTACMMPVFWISVKKQSLTKGRYFSLEMKRYAFRSFSGNSHCGYSR